METSIGLSHVQTLAEVIKREEDLCHRKTWIRFTMLTGLMELKVAQSNKGVELSFVFFSFQVGVSLVGKVINESSTYTFLTTS